MRYWARSTACSRTSNDAASASRAAFGSRMVLQMELAKAMSGQLARCLTRTSGRDPRPGRTSPRPKPDPRLVPFGTKASPPRPEVVRRIGPFVVESSSARFEIAQKYPRMDRTPVNQFSRTRELKSPRVRLKSIYCGCGLRELSLVENPFRY